ncbi:MAG: hypothetical protein JXB39_14835 [Deltaproteobacteria bacterium]|nr:hypothetical protein [Deltaproteobacteria bacterium]
MAERSRSRMPDLAGVRLWLKRAFTTDIGFKVLSTVFALAIWAWVQGERVVEQTGHVEVDWILPDDLTPIEDLPQDLTLTVSGSQAFVKNVRRSDLRLPMDLSRARSGRQKIQFDEHQVDGVPENVRIVSLSPTSAEIELDEKVKRKFKVTPVTSGEPASGFRLVAVTARPSTVELEGPRTVLAGLSTVSTAVVDIGDIKNDVDREVSLIDLPKHVHRVGGEPVQVGVDVEPVRASVELQGVRVAMGTRGWEVSPATVAVSLEGPAARIESLESSDVWVLVEVEEGAPLQSLRASGVRGEATWRVFQPYGEEVQVKRIRPETLDVRPAR